MTATQVGSAVELSVTRLEADSKVQPAIRWGVLLGLLLVAIAVLILWGIQQELPYVPNIDEPTFLVRAIHMASSGDLNPHWFGNPGSTVIYPLVMLARAWNFLAYRGMMLRPDPLLARTFEQDSAPFYMLGRLLSIAYTMLTWPLLFVVGRRVFNQRVALAAVWLAAVCPLLIYHARLIRTDAAATFFGLLSLWLCLRLYDHPGTWRHVLAGGAIGLGVSTRYFMASLVVMLFAVDVMLIWRERDRRAAFRRFLPGMLAGLAAVGIVFALSSPYFFLDFEQALSDIRVEARTTHLGADGLSPLGNFLFYLTDAIPKNIYALEAVLAGAGALLIVGQRRTLPMLLLGFVVFFIAATSLLALHWSRWIIEILPLVALLAAYALDTLVQWLGQRRGVSPGAMRLAFVGAVLLVSAWSLYQVVLLDVRSALPGTRVLAREWIVQNLPAGSKIAEEWYTAPLNGTDYAVQEMFSLAEGGRLKDYAMSGTQYLVTSDAIYGRYLSQPERYPAEVAFYQSLFQRGRLMQEFPPGLIRGGPTVRIYALP